MTAHDNKHLTLDQRQLIEKGLNNNNSFKQIALSISKDCSTVSKEVRRNRVIRDPSAFVSGSMRCALFRTCKARHLCIACPADKKLCKNCIHQLCTAACPDFTPITCDIADNPPYVCNGCEKFKSCPLQHIVYNSEAAQKKYSSILHGCRSGLNLTEEELRHIDEIVSPLLRAGQSPYNIIQNHKDELMISEKTLYLLIGSGLLTARPIDLPRAVRRKPRKQKSVKLKVDRACTIGRTYHDYLAYMDEHPDSLVVEGDSVEGRKGGKCILTLEWVAQAYQIGFLRDHNDALSVTQIFQSMYAYLGEVTFFTLFDVLLVDNGSEFSDPSKIEELGSGDRHIHVFYCEPNRSDEKGACENNHSNFRRIVPKGYSMDFFTQDHIGLCFSNINGMHRRSQGSLTAFYSFHLCFDENAVKLDLFAHVRQIEGEINLTPSLLPAEIMKKAKEKNEMPE